MSKFLCFLLLLMTLLSSSQVIDYLNPQFKGKVKSAHYIIYFDAGKSDFAEPYDGEIVKEYQYSFDKEGHLEAILEIQNVGDCPFILEFDNGKIKAFVQNLWNGNFLQKGEISWNDNSYQITSFDIFKNTTKQKFVLDTKSEIQEATIETYTDSKLSKQEHLKVVRQESVVKKILSSKSYPNAKTVENCEIEFSDLQFDSTGNLIAYRTKDSCSLTYEKHKINIVYWQ
ncbi:hypothetical protein [Epilithonimonas zeae]|nr:hypothetical protein [Epilithonimonas zeae]